MQYMSLDYLISPKRPVSRSRAHSTTPDMSVCTDVYGFRSTGNISGIQLTFQCTLDLTTAVSLHRMGQPNRDGKGDPELLG
jgi:hypothetical protein